MKVKIFWQEECPNCPPAKDLGKKLEQEKINVEYFNVKEVDGLAEATNHGIMSTPSIVIVNDKDEEIAVWRSEIPNIEEIRKHI